MCFIGEGAMANVAEQAGVVSDAEGTRQRIIEAAGSIFAPSFKMRLPRLRMSSMPGFMGLFSQNTRKLL